MYLLRFVMEENVVLYSSVLFGVAVNTFLSNFKRDRFFIKINLREDVWKQNLRILLRFTETPGISNKQTRKLPLLICLLEMLGVFVNFTKMRNFCLQTSSNRIILKEMRSLLEFEDIGFKMAMYCHPYYHISCSIIM